MYQRITGHSGLGDESFSHLCGGCIVRVRLRVHRPCVRTGVGISHRGRYRSGVSAGRSECEDGGSQAGGARQARGDRPGTHQLSRIQPRI